MVLHHNDRFCAENGVSNGKIRPPDTLLSLPQWVGWQWVQRDGKWTKVPKGPNADAESRSASTTDANDWLTYDEAVAYAAAKKLDGVGFVFSEDDPFAGVDLDDCVDPDTGQIHPDAQAIIDDLDSYAEVSPSGTGVKLFLQGDKPGDRNRTGNTPWNGELEMYFSGRFFTFTGWRLPEAPKEVRPAGLALKGLYFQMFGSSAEASDRNPASGVSPLTDEGVISEAERINGDKFRRLFYDGDISAYGNDNSRGRAALIGILRWFAHDDKEQIERIMRRSKLDQSRWNGNRSGQTFLSYEINRLTGKPLDDYYAMAGNLNPEFVSSHYREGRFDWKQKTEKGTGDELVSSHGGWPNDGKRILKPKTVDELIAEAGIGPNWVVHGFLAKGWLTDLVGPAKKSGKTTFVMHKVRSILDGQPFLDFLTTKTNVVYLTEQASSVVEAVRGAGLDVRNDGFHVFQWKDHRGWDWEELVDEVAQYAEEVDAGLIVIDTLNRFAGLKGESENIAGEVSEVMAALMAAAQKHNIAILSIRHANKEGKARGSTQFDHDVDALFELQPYGGNGNDNMRVLEGVGRSDEIPGKLNIELTDDGYRNMGTGDSVRFKMAVKAIKDCISTDADNPSLRPALLEAVNEEYGIAEKTARRALDWLCEQEDGIVRTGEGKKGSPYTYHLPLLDTDEEGSL